MAHPEARTAPGDRSGHRTVASLLLELLDDAALFPPGNAEMAAAVPDHLLHRRSEYSRWIGPFVCPADRVDELAKAATGLPPGSLEVALTVPGGPGQLAGALTDIGRLAAVRPVAVELPLQGAAPERIASTVRRSGSPIPVYAELPFADVPAAATELRSVGLRLKLRTGGTVATAFPGERALAGVLAVAVGAGLAFKCTAGLHQAVRHHDPTTGFDHHGFLNIALAVHQLGRGETADTARATLAETDEEAVAAAVRLLTGPDIDRLRAAFRSFGTCSVLDPLTDLQRIGLLERQEYR